MWLTVIGMQSDGVRMLREEVTEVDIADIVSKWTGIPVQLPTLPPTSPHFTSLIKSRPMATCIIKHSVKLGMPAM